MVHVSNLKAQLSQALLAMYIFAPKSEIVTGYCTPNQKLPCFVLYLNIIHIFFWKKKTTTTTTIYASYIKLSKELKNSIDILVGQAVLKLWIKQLKYCFDQ